MIRVDEAKANVTKYNEEKLKNFIELNKSTFDNIDQSIYEASNAGQTSVTLPFAFMEIDNIEKYLEAIRSFGYKAIFQEDYISKNKFIKQGNIKISWED